VIVLVTLTVALVIWIVAWAFGIKSFDAFMFATFLVVVAAAARLWMPFINQLLGREAASSDELGPPSAPGAARE
jgi:hypothetical protein